MTVHYQGSAEHKRYPYRGMPPSFDVRSDSTECPPDVDGEHASEVLEAAIAAGIRSGNASETRDGDHPRYVWGRSRFRTVRGQDEDIAWEARLTNRTQAMYKAYPIRPCKHYKAMPSLVRRRLWPHD